jgi:hypothetical protein
MYVAMQSVHGTETLQPQGLAWCFCSIPCQRQAIESLLLLGIFNEVKKASKQLMSQPQQLSVIQKHGISHSQFGVMWRAFLLGNPSPAAGYCQDFHFICAKSRLMFVRVIDPFSHSPAAEAGHTACMMPSSLRILVLLVLPHPQKAQDSRWFSEFY